MTMIRFGREIEENNFSPVDLKKKAIIYDKDDIGKLTLRGSESLQHYLAKAMLVYHLKKMKHRVVCEVRIESIGYLDVLDIDVGVIYEIEKCQSPKTAMRFKEIYKQAGIDVIIIPIRNAPDSMSQLSDFIQHWIRPD